MLHVPVYGVVLDPGAGEGHGAPAHLHPLYHAHAAQI